MFAIEVEFLTGVSVAASPNRRDEAEWPPHPDRLFQAFVAAWGRNDPPDDPERKALEWFEALDTDQLVVSAPQGHPRDVVTVFVPPNDARTTGKPGDDAPRDLAGALHALPQSRKNRQPRTFPAVVPAAELPIVRYVWKLDDEQSRGLQTNRAPLEQLAREVTYLGHSHTIVRVAILDNAASNQASDNESITLPTALRTPHPGRLRHLQERYRRSFAENRIVRPSPSLAMKTLRRSKELDSSTLFDADNVTVFADAGGFAPALAAFPLAAKRLRDALLECAPHDAPIPPLLSGHDGDGRPTQEPHMALVPLADVGWAHSQGRLMGLALVWPRNAAGADRHAALRIVASFLRDQGSVGLLHFGRAGSWSLALEPEAERASLRFERYARLARRWGTVLPAALDRHPKERVGDDLADIVARACLNVGLPESVVDGLDVEIHKYASVKGGPPVREVLRALPADSPYRTKPFVHLVLAFARPIRGPLILGAGRFRGLGLCLPLDKDMAS